jgi:uncharacterized protein (DUF983 family)
MKKTKKPAAKKNDPWLVEFPWVCPDCGHAILHSYGALADVGNPICEKCDCDMELQSVEG